MNHRLRMSMLLLSFLSEYMRLEMRQQSVQTLHERRDGDDRDDKRSRTDERS